MAKRLPLQNDSAELLQFGRDVLHDEARALDALADSLGDSFVDAVDCIRTCRGKLIVSGLGKSGRFGESGQICGSRQIASDCR